MSEGGRLALILGTIALAAGGGGYYFFKIYRPSHELAGAQSEIGEWEKRFTAARECLLGKTPASSKTSEALAVREMSPDPWDRKSCTPLIGKLSRGDAPDTGIPAVEQAWTDLEKSASKAALAYARHVSESTTLDVDPLPPALDELDGARRALRTAAHMTSSDTADKTLPAAQVISIADGNDPVMLLAPGALPSAHGMVAFGNTSSRLVQVLLTTGGAPKIARVGPNSFRSIPGMDWGIAAAGNETRVGAFDAEGVIATSAFSAPTTPDLVHAATGTLDDGLAVFNDERVLVTVRASQGQVTQVRREGKAPSVAVDADGRIAVVWGDEHGSFGRILGPGGAEQPLVTIPMDPIAMCLTRDRVWLQAGSDVAAFGGNRPTYTHDLASATRNRGGEIAPGVRFTGTESAGYNPPHANDELRGCTPDAALFQEWDSITVCSDECRPATLPAGAPQIASLTVVDGKLVAVSAHGNVLGVWRQDAAPVFYALSEPLGVLPTIMTDGKVIDTLATGKGAVKLLRVPAR